MFELNSINKRRLKTLTKQIGLEKAKISKARDALRELISEVEDIIGDADEVVNTLDRACDDLSRYV
jgi:predicted DNA-binding protein